MSSLFNTRTGAALVAGTMMVAILAGCGTSLNTPAAVRSNADAQAMEATVLKKALERIHQAVYTRLDVDANKSIDEYEAGPNLTLKDFKNADKNNNHKLTYAEFKKYAVTELFFFKDTPDSFLKRFRQDLGSVFRRLDSNKDGMLVKNEVSNADLTKLRLTFEYPRLNITVKVQKCSPEMFAAADRTADSRLGEAEFEDLYIEAVVGALGGAGGSEPTPPAPSEEPAPPAPSEEPAPPAEDPANTKSKTKKRK
jgi:hypothetical protein